MVRHSGAHARSGASKCGRPAAQSPAGSSKKLTRHGPNFGTRFRSPTFSKNDSNLQVDPKNGSTFGTHIADHARTFFKVYISWSWTQWLIDSLGGLDEAVVMNLDETGVPLFMGDLRGSIMREPRAGRGKVLPTQNMPRSFTRAAVTHVAIICNGPETQLYLPQLFLGDSSTLTVQAQRDVQAAAPPNVTVWRLQSRWLDVAVVKTLLRTISLNLRANSPGLRPVLIWDCCPAHVKDEALRAARS